MTKYYNLHARITEEEYVFLKNMGVNKSKLVRDAIHKLMGELPENLKKRKNELLIEVKKIDEKLENVKERIAEKKDYLDVIAGDFQKFKRLKYNDSQNIIWLKNRYESELARRNILMSMEEILEYCIQKSKTKKGGEKC